MKKICSGLIIRLNNILLPAFCCLALPGQKAEPILVLPVRRRKLLPDVFCSIFHGKKYGCMLIKWWEKHKMYTWISPANQNSTHVRLFRLIALYMYFSNMWIQIFSHINVKFVQNVDRKSIFGKIVYWAIRQASNRLELYFMRKKTAVIFYKWTFFLQRKIVLFT